MQKRPNVLFLMTDQYRADLAGFAGNNVVRTPNLDKLAEDAVVFDSAYAPSPICVPGRQCMMSGQLPQTCDCLTFGDDLAPGHMTFAKRFSQYAYNTVCCGKLHHHGTDMYQGWTNRIGWDNPISQKFIDGAIPEEFEKYPAHNGADQWWNWEKEIKRAGVGCGPHQRKDEYAVAGALEYIDEYFCSPFYDLEKGHKPLMLKVSLRLPHYPYFTDEQKFNYYLNRVNVFHEETRIGHPQHPAEWEDIGSVSEREVRRATAAYYGMVETTDEMFGSVVAQLEHVGQNIDDWIVVFTSDHGDLLGEHGMWMKAKFLEGSARVPFFIRYPKKYNGRRISQNVSQCDIFRTLCEMAELKTPDGLDSRSLLPLMSGEFFGWDNEAISQLGDNIMIKQDSLKYIYSGNGDPELLFDLGKDSGETRNIIADAYYASELDKFRKRLAEINP